jgi:hypothetical protein
MTTDDYWFNNVYKSQAAERIRAASSNNHHITHRLELFARQGAFTRHGVRDVSYAELLVVR